MYRIAIKTLFHVPGKALGAMIGVAAAGTLILAQVGLYLGFLITSSAFIDRTGGDLWVMARGTQVFDNGETIGPSARERLASHRCVSAVSAVVVDYAMLRTDKGELLTTQVLGVDTPSMPSSSGWMPWSMQRGLPSAIRGPSRVIVESLDVETLSIKGDPIGARLALGEDEVVVAALSRGIRPFTLTPYVFADLPLARRLVGAADGHATYWIADLHDAACAPAVIAHVRGHAELDAQTTAGFVHSTQDFWVNNSGIGTMLMFGAVLALIVGMIIIGQTLNAITRSHLRELGTLKALGASGAELVGFVLWQALLLACSGGAVAAILTYGLRQMMQQLGLEVVLNAEVLALGISAIIIMCGLASLGSIRTVLRLDVSEVLK